MILTKIVFASNIYIHVKPLSLSGTLLEINPKILSKMNKFNHKFDLSPFSHMRKQWRSSAAVTMQLISAFVFKQSPYFLNLKFQASNHLLWLYNSVCIEPGQKPRRQVFSRCDSYLPYLNQELSFVFYTFLKNFPKMKGRSPFCPLKTHCMYVFKYFIHQSISIISI